MPRNDFTQRMNDRFAWFAEWQLDRRLLVILGFVALCVGAIVLSTRLQLCMDLIQAFAPDDEAEYYQDFLEEYGNDAFIYILYRAGGKEGVFNLNILRKTQELVEDLKNVPQIREVNSITNLEFLEGTVDGDLKVYALMDEFPTTQKEADQLKAKLLNKPMFVNGYVSEDGQYAAIVCELESIPEKGSVDQEAVVTSIKIILDRPDYQEFSFYPVGDPVLQSTLTRLHFENLTLMTCINSIVLASLLIFLFRQTKGLVAPMGVWGFCTLLALGFMAVFGFRFTTVSPMIVSILAPIAIADAVHILSEYQIHLEKGHDNRRSIIEAVRLLGFPCLFTSLTTAVGFASLSISPMWGIRDFGLYIAFGVFAAFGITFTILLVFISFGGDKTERKFRRVGPKEGYGLMARMLQWIADLNRKFYRQILVISIVLTAIAAYGISKVEINSSLLWQLGDRIGVYNDYKFVDETMGGTGNFEILLKSNESEGVKTLKFMQTLEKVQDFANAQESVVGKTISIVDVVKDINSSMHYNDRSFYRLPGSDNEIAQCMLLYEMSGGEQLEQLVSGDLETARLTVFVRTPDSKSAKKFYEALAAFTDSEKPSEYAFRITGTSFLMQKLWGLIGQTMVKSLLLAISIISIMMLFVFRSLRVGFLSMIPNVMPVVFTVGLMGFCGIWLNEITVFIGCIAIGIAIDDTIHFMSRYWMEFNSSGDYEKALEATMHGVGRAITITTIICCIGFGMNMVSKLDGYFYLGLLVSTCLFVAFLADLFLMPSLILAFRPFGGARRV